jgi:hypothetical protein
MTIAEFAARLNDNPAALRTGLLNGPYVPEPFQKIHIPKTVRQARCVLCNGMPDPFEMRIDITAAC